MALIPYLSNYLFSSRFYHLALRPLFAILNFINDQLVRVGKLLRRRTCLSPYTLEFIPRSFDEENRTSDSDLHTRTISFHLRLPPRYWRCKVTFRGALPMTGKLTAQKKRQDLEDLCRCIDFRRCTLLDDTVTEFVVTRDGTSPNSPLQRAPQANSEYGPIADGLSIHAREDPNRVVFPPFEYPSNVRVEDISRIQKIRRLHGGVYEVRLCDDESTYVYKEVDRPIYAAGDSDILEREFQNLQAFRGVSCIVQLIAAVVSSLPYQTLQPGGPPVLRGILLEYHPNGPLSDHLGSNTARSWTRWALQVAEAVSHLHDKDIAHMDLKPGNVVVSREEDAILIDVSGRGFTYEWLSPDMAAEMADVDDVLFVSLASRKFNDIWALGKIFGEMALVSPHEAEQKLLRHLELAATTEIPTSRIRLDEIICTLQHNC